MSIKKWIGRRRLGKRGRMFKFFSNLIFYCNHIYTIGWLDSKRNKGT